MYITAFTKKANVLENYKFKLIFEIILEKIEDLLEIYLNNSLLFNILIFYRLKENFLKNVVDRLRKAQMKDLLVFLFLLFSNFAKLYFYNTPTGGLKFTTELFLQLFFYLITSNILNFTKNKNKVKFLNVNLPLLLLTIVFFPIFYTDSYYEFLNSFFSLFHLKTSFLSFFNLILSLSPAICEVIDYFLCYKYKDYNSKEFLEDTSMFLNNCFFMSKSNFNISIITLVVLSLLAIVRLLLTRIYKITIDTANMTNYIILESSISSLSYVIIFFSVIAQKVLTNKFHYALFSCYMGYICGLFMVVFL